MWSPHSVVLLVLTPEPALQTPALSPLAAPSSTPRRNPTRGGRVAPSAEIRRGPRPHHRRARRYCHSGQDSGPAPVVAATATCHSRQASSAAIMTPLPPPAAVISFTSSENGPARAGPVSASRAAAAGIPSPPRPSDRSGPLHGSHRTAHGGCRVGTQQRQSRVQRRQHPPQWDWLTRGQRRHLASRLQLPSPPHWFSGGGSDHGQQPDGRTDGSGAAADGHASSGRGGGNSDDFRLMVNEGQR